MVKSCVCIDVVKWWTAECGKSSANACYSTLRVLRVTRFFSAGTLGSRFLRAGGGGVLFSLQGIKFFLKGEDGKRATCVVGCTYLMRLRFPPILLGLGRVVFGCVLGIAFEAELEGMRLSGV